MKGYICKNLGLWRIPLKGTILNENMDTIIIDRPNPGESISHVFELTSTENTIKYMHAAAGLPVKETWIRAVRDGNYITWPGLSVKSIRKYYPDDAEETLKGHMRGQRQGFRSTKERREKEPNEDKTPKQKQNDIYTTRIDLKREIHTYQTGKFLHLSSKGNRYIIVEHNIDENYIFMDTMKNILKRQMMACYQRIVSRIKKAGLTLRKLHHLILEIGRASCIK